jgi:hypothetical protein
MNSQLHSLRPALPDVPAVYFVAPTLANVKRIAQDLQKSLYESFHLNFVEPLPRALLEELAASVAQDGTGEQVEEVRCLLSQPLNTLTDFGPCMALGRGPIPVFHRSFPFTILPPAASTTSTVCKYYWPSTRLHP